MKTKLRTLLTMWISNIRIFTKGVSQYWWWGPHCLFFIVKEMGNPTQKNILKYWEAPRSLAAVRLLAELKFEATWLLHKISKPYYNQMYSKYTKVYLGPSFSIQGCLSLRQAIHQGAIDQAVLLICSERRDRFVTFFKALQQIELIQPCLNSVPRFYFPCWLPIQQPCLPTVSIVNTHNHSKIFMHMHIYT